VRLFDRFFDCFNVRCVSESIREKKPDHRDPTDSRLEVASSLYYGQGRSMSNQHRLISVIYTAKVIGTEVQLKSLK
jgi:hypothetical protein